MDAVDMLRLIFVVELRPLAVGRFSRNTGCDDNDFDVDNECMNVIRPL